MHRYQKWLSVGLFALTPGLATAGAIDSPILKPNQGAPSAAARPAKIPRAVANQELADKVARALRKSKLDGYDIDIDVRDGVVILEGFVIRAEQRTAAAKAVRAVPGVSAVNNRLRVGEPISRPQTNQSSTGPSEHSAVSRVVRPANYEAGKGRPAAIVQAAAYDVGPTEATAPMPQPATGATAYGSPAGAAGNAVYIQPNIPAAAGPMYAQNQSSAGAWPYMGPFQPYPQCPLGWQKVTMYWDEGLWKIDFGGKKARSW